MVQRRDGDGRLEAAATWERSAGRQIPSAMEEGAFDSLQY
jgi:hypothetical protein